MHLKLSPYILGLTTLIAISCSGFSANQNLECIGITNLEFTETVRCGTIEVPEDHAKPNEKKITLAYVIIPAKQKEGVNYPILQLRGGPGGKSLTRGGITRFFTSSFRDDRDIILFDQRGVGLSSALPNMNEEIFQILAENLNTVEEKTEMRKLLARMKQKVMASGRSLSDYNTSQNAKDIGILMKNLGYKKYNLMGGSYGTTLGRVVQDLYPEYLHSVVHNSPNSLKGDFLELRIKSYQLALNRLFTWCEGDPQCTVDYSNLKSRYIGAIASLKEQPITVQTAIGPFTINAQDGIYLIRRMLYLNQAKTIVPRLILALNARNLDFLERIIRIEKQYNEALNFSMHLAVSSFEQTESYVTDVYIDSLYHTSELFPVPLGFFDAFYSAGKNWSDKKASETDRQFKLSHVPTLVLVNYYDPVTPPENGVLFKTKLPNGQLLVLDEEGHGGVRNSACRDQVIKAFMDNPNQKLNTKCLRLHSGFN